MHIELLAHKPIRKNEDYPDLYQELTPFKTNQIVQKGSYGIVGTTVNGQTILFPDSYQRGFLYELTPLNERPRTDFEIPGLVTATSDGHMNYAPSFTMGREIAKELKLHALANKIKNVSQENEGLKGIIQDLKNKVEDLIKKQKS